MRHTMLSLLGVLVLAAYGTAAPPQFTSVGDSLTDSLNEDSQYAVTLTADDPDTETVTFSLLAPVPTGMTIDSATGAVAWTPTNDEVGDNTVTAAVTDSAGEADTVTWTLTVVNVNDAPVLEASTPAQADFYLLTGTDQEFGVTVSDVDAGDAITYAFAVDGVVQGAPGAVDTFVLNLGAESTAVVSFTATDGSADTLTGSWTVRYVDAYPDSLVPSVTGVRHFTRGTNDVSDDEIIVTFSQDIDDASISGLSAADVFGIIGTGSCASAVLGTGETADDNMLTISLAGADTLPAQTGDMLTLRDGMLKSGMNIPCSPDTDTVISYRVALNGTEYVTITEAVAAAGSGDTITVTAGTFVEALPLPTLLLTAAAGARPVIRYNGTGSSIVTSASYGAHPVIAGFEFDGVSDSSDTVTSIISGRLIDVSGCILHDATGRLFSETGDVVDCEIYNAGTGIYSRANSVQFINNYIHDCGTAIGQYRGDNKVITGNVITGCDLVFYIRSCSGLLFSNNLVYANTSVLSLYSSEASSGTVYRNNTITRNARDGLRINGTWGATLENNIIAHNGLDDTSSYVDLVCSETPTAGEQVNNNIIGTADANGQTLLAMPRSTGNKVGVNPGFADAAADDFHLGVLSAGTDASDDLDDAEDYDGSQADLGCYGGPDALDTLMPAAIESAYVVRADTVDTLVWAESADDDFGMYVIVRANMDSGSISTEDGELVDTIGTRATTRLAVPNNGGKWFYAVQAVDTMGYGGGVAYAVSSVTGEIVVIPDETVALGLIEINSFVYAMVGLLNVGAETLTVSDVSLAQGTYAAVVDTNGDSLDLPIKIAPDAAYAVVITAMPDDYVTIADTLTIRSDDPDAADSLITLVVSGEVGQPVLGYPSEGRDYGSVDVNTSDTIHYFSIGNDGTDTLVIDTIWYADGTNFNTTLNMTSLRTLLPGESFRVTTYCSPQVSGTLLDTMYVSSNDPVTPIAAIPFTATGVSGINDFVAGTIGGVRLDITGNPVAGRLGLVFTVAGSKRLTVDVFDANGIAVHRLADGTFSGTVELTASRDLAAGTYFVMVRSDDERMVRKVVVE